MYNRHVARAWRADQRQSFLVTVLVGSALLLFGALGTTASASTPIVVAAANALDHSHIFVAVDEGFFDKYDLDVRVVLYPTGIEIINALQSGQAQFATLGVPPFLSAASRGVPIVLVAHQSGEAYSPRYNSANAIAARRDSGVRPGHPEDLTGKRVGLALGTGGEQYFRGVFTQRGLSTDGIEIVNLSPSDAVTALLDRSIDALAFWEPWPTIAAQRVDGAYEVMRGNSTFGDAPTLLAMAPFVDRNPDTVWKFLLAFNDAHRWVRENLDKTAEIATRWISGLDPEVARRSIQNISFDTRVSRYTIGTMEATMEALAAQGRLEPFDLSKHLRIQAQVAMERQHPEFFDDMPPIPAEARLPE